MASTSIRLAYQLIDSLKKDGHLPDTREADAVLKELFRAYFCLASLHAARHLQKPAGNSYRLSMLNSLRKHESDLVRETFLEGAVLDEAFACYLQGKLSVQDREAIDACRKPLRLSEENVLQNFAAKVYVRLMRLLGSDVHKILFIGDLPFLLAVWISTMSFITSANASVLNKLTPVMEE